jgi:hypothetical protein
VTTYRVLLPHPLEPRLLLMQSHGEWRLPEWEDVGGQPWYATNHVNRAVAARFGVETTVLRCVRETHEPPPARSIRVYELDNRSVLDELVPASRWVGRDELELLRTPDPAARELMGEWFSRESGELPLRGPPWARRGWTAEALAWASDRLREAGATVTAAPDQLRAWERSFLMRIPTTEGACYFKAVPPMFSHEPRLMQWLEEHYPDNVPQLVAVDTARGWILQKEANGAALPLNEVREEEEWYRTVRRLAEIQADSARHTRELKQLGVPHRGLEILARRIPGLCADAGAMLPGERDGLTGQERERVASLAPTLLALCEELASYELPDALEHGDLRASNVLSTLAAPIYLDWSDSSLAHPFFSLSQLMMEATVLLPASSRESRRRLRDNYLAPWRGHASRNTLIRAFEVARVLAPVHLAAIVHAELLPATGHRWELEAFIPTHLRIALRLLLDESAPSPL